MKQRKLLLNASNLHVGGGVQVATSVIGEWCSFPEIPDSVEIWVSSEVDSNLRELGYKVSRLNHYKIVNTYGISMAFSKAVKNMAEYSKVLTIFGPLYQFRKKSYTITGFAQAWIIYPDNVVYSRLSVIKRLITRLKFLMQKVFFKKSDELFVELEHVKTGLELNNICPGKSISVIHNCVNSIYFEKQKWKQLKSPTNDNKKIKFGFVGRNYLHKNTSLFPYVVSLLKTQFDIDAEFYVTFTDEEWTHCSDFFKQHVFNLGQISVAECPSFYNAMDAIVFPSLLESFSATPLEAMVMRKILFASNKGFNRDICGEFAIYFDPLNAEDLALKIANFVALTQSEQHEHIEKAFKHAVNFSSAKERAIKILNLLNER